MFYHLRPPSITFIYEGRTLEINVKFIAILWLGIAKNVTRRYKGLQLSFQPLAMVC